MIHFSALLSNRPAVNRTGRALMLCEYGTGQLLRPSARASLTAHLLRSLAILVDEQAEIVDRIRELQR